MCSVSRMLIAFRNNSPAGALKNLNNLGWRIICFGLAGGVYDKSYAHDYVGGSFISAVRTRGFERRDIYTYSSTGQYAFASDTARCDHIHRTSHGHRVRIAEYFQV